MPGPLDGCGRDDGCQTCGRKEDGDHGVRDGHRLRPLREEDHEQCAVARQGNQGRGGRPADQGGDGDLRRVEKQRREHHQGFRFHQGEGRAQKGRDEVAASAAKSEQGPHIEVPVFCAIGCSGCCAPDTAAVQAGPKTEMAAVQV